MTISRITLSKRRIAGGLAAGIAASLMLVVATPADAGITRSAPGLFGSADPTYDGVYRQSMALLGLAAAKAPIPAAAVSWLVGQQCANGSYLSFRQNTSAPCPAADPAKFVGPDSNSTALGAMALHATGRAAQAARALAALIATQNADGGWGYTLGGGSDVNSTGLALAALKGVPSAKTVRTSINRATGYITSAQVACTAPVDSRFGLPYQPGQKADVLASGQGLVGIAGTLPASPGSGANARLAKCSSTLSQQVASYLAQLLRTNAGMVPAVFDSSMTDWNATATAVLALTATGGARSAVNAGLGALGANTASYTGTGATASPAALGTLIQAAVNASASPRRFGLTKANLVVELLATLQK